MSESEPASKSLWTDFCPLPMWSAQDAFSALMFSELDFECPPWPQLSPDAKDFVQHLLVKDPAKRATAIEALDHRCSSYASRLRLWPQLPQA